MSLLKYVMGVAVAISLTACGGGGGNASTPSTPDLIPLIVSAPSTVTVETGASTSYIVSGGQTPYRAVSGNSSIAQVAINKDNGLTVMGLVAGTSTVQVRDALSALVEITVNVSAGPAVALYTTTPNPLSMAPSTTQKFGIGGGVPPYTVTSDNVSVATVLVSDSVLTVTAATVGTANLKITDISGTSISTAINVVSSGVPLSISPTSASVYVDNTLDVMIVGGTPPYRIGGTIPAFMTAVFDNANPSRLIITSVLTGGPFELNIFDSQNSTVKFELTIIAGQPTIRLSPSILKVSELDTKPITLTIFGAAAGTLHAFSSDLALFTVAVGEDNKTITVNTGSKGNRCITNDATGTGTGTSDYVIPVTISVVDSTRALATSVITITNSVGACP